MGFPAEAQVRISARIASMLSYRVFLVRLTRAVREYWRFLGRNAADEPEEFPTEGAQERRHS